MSDKAYPEIFNKIDKFNQEQEENNVQKPFCMYLTDEEKEQLDEGIKEIQEKGLLLADKYGVDDKGNVKYRHIPGALGFFKDTILIKN